MYFVMFLLVCGIIAATSLKNLTYSEKSLVKSFFFLRKRKRLATEHMLWKLQMPEHADYCPVNAGNITCWADSARQKCIGLNMTTESIYSKIKAAAPDLKKMHEMYHRCAGAAVAKSKCRKGHKHIKNYEEVRHQCRHLLGARPRCNFKKAVEEWPVYIISDKPEVVDRVRSFGFRNVVRIPPIFARSQLDVKCEMQGRWGVKDWVRNNYGPLGLSYVHRNIYITMAEAKRPCAFVFEEDFHLAPHWRERLRKGGIEKFVAKRDFMFMKLDYCKWHNKGPPKTACSRDPVKIAPGQGGACTDAYLISAWGACVLARANTPIAFNSDGIMDYHHFRDKLPLVKADAPEPEFIDRFSKAPNKFIFHTDDELAWQNMEEIPKNRRPKYVYTVDGKKISVTWGVFKPLRTHKGEWGLTKVTNGTQRTGC